MGIIQLFSERVFYQGKVCTNAFHLSNIFKLFVVLVQNPFWVLSPV